MFEPICQSVVRILQVQSTPNVGQYGVNSVLPSEFKISDEKRIRCLKSPLRGKEIRHIAPSCVGRHKRGHQGDRRVCPAQE